MLYAELDAVDETSETIRGDQLPGPDLHRLHAAALQCVRQPNAGDYTILLEGGFAWDGDITWSTVATVTQAEDTNLITLTLADAAYYRFRMTAGTVAVRCILN